MAEKQSFNHAFHRKANRGIFTILYFTQKVINPLSPLLI